MITLANSSFGSTDRRAHFLNLLVESMSMRAVGRYEALKGRNQHGRVPPIHLNLHALGVALCPEMCRLPT